MPMYAYLFFIKLQTIEFEQLKQIESYLPPLFFTEIGHYIIFLQALPHIFLSL